MATKPDYYEMLGVPRRADEQAIRKAFHAAIRDVRPDAERLRQLAEAYSVLSKPSSRVLYDRFGFRGRGNSNFDETLLEAAEPQGRGLTVHAPLELRPVEARQGVSRAVRYEALQMCNVCEGTGGECGACKGTGRRRVERTLQVRVPPGLEDRSQLRVTGEGDVARRGGMPGDLLLDIRVLGQPRDYGLVRYLAFALFIAALALLVAYLFLG